MVRKSMFPDRVFGFVVRGGMDSTQGWCRCLVSESGRGVGVDCTKLFFWGVAQVLENKRLFAASEMFGK